MQRTSLNTIFLIAACALSTGATAQNTYKCGDTYSQVPCPGAKVIDATDSRTPAQKTQADLATGRVARTADAMEKARLQQEKIDSAANASPVPPAQMENASASGTMHAKKKRRKAPDYFTAQAPGEKKKAAKKRTAKKDATKS
jgi:hypothetical protein